MKKKIISMIISLVVIMGLIISGCNNSGNKETIPPQNTNTNERTLPPQNTNPDGRVRPSQEASPDDEIAAPQDEITAPQEASTDILILVNNDNKLPNNYDPDLTTSGAPMANIVRDGFGEMRTAAREDNITLLIASAYRSADEQERLLNELGSSIAARPGYSEHQTGLAIDFSYGGLTQEETNRMWAWLAKNAYKYGFILRYPEGREDITGFAYEPWHYRYVGKEHAKAIYEQDLVLEEYLTTYQH